MSGLQRPPPGGGSGRPGGGAQQMKLVLLGDQGVGKSSLALRFVRGDFREDQEATIGAAFLTQTVNVQGKNIKFDIWDTAGQERYHSLAPMYYRGAQAAIVVYDITSTSSFERAMTWVTELVQQSNGAIVVALAGNKIDIAGGNREVSRGEALTYAEENNLLFTETSAKRDTGVSELFMAVAKRLANQPGPNTGGLGPRSSIRLDQQHQEKKKKCC